MKINSKKFPDVAYEKGEEIFLTLDKCNVPFRLDVEDTLTENDDTMDMIGQALDTVNALVMTAKDYLKSTLSKEDSDDCETVKYFMEFHRDELVPDDVCDLFKVDEPSQLKPIDMVDYLKLKRFGCAVSLHDDKPEFIMDLTFDSDMTDELMVIYFNLDKQVVRIAHES